MNSLEKLRVGEGISPEPNGLEQSTQLDGSMAVAKAAKAFFWRTLEG